MFFAHWSSDETTYRDMEKVNAFCGQCNSEQLHTLRLYEKKTKHYSVVALGSKKRVSAICHGCLKEYELEKNEEKTLVKKFTIQIRCQEGFEAIDEKKFNKAIKKFTKNLKEDNEDVNSMYGLTKCMISQGRYDDANNCLVDLESKLPENPDVKELRQVLEANRH